MDLSDVWSDWAPGLRTLPDTLSGLRQVIDSGDLTSLADPTRVDSYVGLLLVGGTGYFAACIVLRQMRRALFAAPAVAPRSPYREKVAVIRATNTPQLQRLWWVVRPPADSMRVDGLVIDRTGQRSHGLWIGPTGRGKSQSVATVRCDGKRPVLAAMPDISDPLRAQADFIWTAGESTEPIDFLLGLPGRVAMMLTEVFRSGGNGVWKRAAFLATKQVITDMDTERRHRSLLAIGRGLEALIAIDRSLRMACEGWVVRFLATAEAFGESAGPGGIDVAQRLRKGQMVVIDNDAWKHPGLKGDVVAFGLAEGRRCADVVPGGFRLIFEEADQLGDRMDLADPFFTAGRRRQVATDALVHSEDKLPDAMTANSATRVYFRPNKPEHRVKVAKALDLTEAEVDEIPDYHAWIDHDGKIRRLVHFPAPPKARVSRQEISAFEKGRKDPGDCERRIVVSEVPRADSGERVRVEEVRPSFPALPPPSTAMQAYVDRTYRDRGCLRWKGKHDRKGHQETCEKSCKLDAHERGNYGYIYLEDEEKSELVHRWRWRQAYGEIGKDPVTGKKLTIDHTPRCARDCSDLTHLSLKTRGANSAARAQDERNGVSYR